MSQRALIIHPNNDYNCGDQLTFLGTKSLLTQALGGSENLDVVQFDMRRAEEELDTYVSQYCWGDIDIVALAGSPWLWTVCEVTSKYKLLLDALDRYPNAKKVALGIGSCFPHCVYHNIMYDKHDEFFYNNEGKRRAKIKEIYDQFSCVYTRDPFAQHLLEDIGVSSKFVYDTSAYASYFLGKQHNNGNKKALWFYDPTKGVSKNDLSFEPEEYITYQLEWAKENNADIFCNSDSDMDSLMKRNIRGSFTVDLIHILNKFTEYNELLTGRIHMGVLGFMADIPKITALPVDSRFLTIIKFGIDIKYIGSEWNYPTINIPDNVQHAIDTDEELIVQELRSALL